MTVIENQRFDEERALYGKKNLTVKHCQFDGPADGESAFKECENIKVEDTFLNLRYPFWHDHSLLIYNAQMTEKCRVAWWYSDHIVIKDSQMHGIKALRECDDVIIENCVRPEVASAL